MDAILFSILASNLAHTYARTHTLKKNKEG